ncbi:hypothetical protein [Chlamydia gallinacea]|uniref:hypothetical protein n=1 Tax=Chlamydia gallinacea TaxID=1457153 RepID=UPI0024E23221|nr:hypothetical protein [Chlamydia gallinacea]
MKKILKGLVVCCLGSYFSLVFGENPQVLEFRSSVQVIPVTGLQFQEKNDLPPYSFYYPYDYGYYYPDTFGSSATANGKEEEECYSRLENGIFFYYCD